MATLLRKSYVIVLFLTIHCFIIIEQNRVFNNVKHVESTDTDFLWFDKNKLISTTIKKKKVHTNNKALKNIILYNFMVLF